MPDIENQQTGEEAKPYSPPEQVKFEKKEGATTQIPTASMPDIVFVYGF
jgi:hypothetical protein